MRNIYDQHRDTFDAVSAFVVLKDGERVATVAFKFPKSGMSVMAYVHWIGTEMSRGVAKGGGYDRQSAAVAAVVSKAQDGTRVNHWSQEEVKAYDRFRAVCFDDNGWDWKRRLEDAGFQVFQAV